MDLKVNLDVVESFNRVSEILQFLETLGLMLSEDEAQLKIYEQLLSFLFSKIQNMSVFCFLLLITLDYVQKF